MNRSQKDEILWQNMFILAEDYYRQHGDLLIPHSYTVNNIRLGAWISSQRTSYHSNTISIIRKEKLEGIAMIWDVHEFQWHQMYNVAKKYYENYGDLMVPTHYITSDGKKLGAWIAQQRKNFSRIGTEKANSRFDEGKIKLLNDLEMVWDASNSTQNTSFAEQCIVYFANKAGLYFKNRTQFSGVEIDILFPDQNIGIEYDGERWHQDIDRDIRKNLICSKAGLKLIRIREPKCPIISDSVNYILNGYGYEELSSTLHTLFFQNFGIDITVDIDSAHKEIVEQYVVYSKQHWKEMLSCLTSYKNTHGNIQVPRDTIINGYSVGSWIHDIRKRNKENHLFISTAQRKQLDELGMIWDIYETTWNEMYSAAKQYYMLNGNLQVSSSFVTETGNNLLSWLNEQRKKYIRGSLSAEYIEKLNALNFDWHPIQNRWFFMYNLAKQYYYENGNLLIPANCCYAGEKLGNWITVQRRKFLHPTKDTGYLSNEQIDLLKEIEMVWDVDESQWLEMFLLCKKYYAQYGNLRINRNFEMDEKKLGVWIGQQRVRYNKCDGSISKEHIAMLDSLGMVWDEMIAKWFDGYTIAKSYFHEFGTVNIPQKTKYKGKALGKWLYNQKNKARNGTLTQEQIHLLTELQLTW